MRFTNPPTDEELLRLYAAPTSPWTRANMVSTLDGRATGADGRSRSLNSRGDKQVFAVLRALASVVVVGAGTVRTEGYRRLRTPLGLRGHRAQAGLADHPVLAVVTASGDLPDTVVAGAPDRGRLLVLCPERMPAPAAERLLSSLDRGDEVVRCGADDVHPVAAVAALHERGLTDVLTEGGPRLLESWIRAGVVDELCLTLRPVLLGGAGPRILDGAGAGPPPAADGDPMLVLEMGRDVMLRYRLRAG